MKAIRQQLQETEWQKQEAEGGDVSVNQLKRKPSDWLELKGWDWMESEFGDNHPLASPVPILHREFPLEEETQPIHPVFTFLSGNPLAKQQRQCIL